MPSCLCFTTIIGLPINVGRGSGLVWIANSSITENNGEIPEWNIGIGSSFPGNGSGKKPKCYPVVFEPMSMSWLVSEQNSQMTSNHLHHGHWHRQHVFGPFSWGGSDPWQALLGRRWIRTSINDLLLEQSNIWMWKWKPLNGTTIDVSLSFFRNLGIYSKQIIIVYHKRLTRQSWLKTRVTFK